MPTGEQGRLSTVLVVEDDDGQRFTIESILRREGFEIISCATAAEALAHVRRVRFGVAVVDLRLPDLEGTQLLTRIQALNGAVKVIIHTAYGSFDSAKESINQGAFAYVEKAGDPDELVRQVHRAFRGQYARYAYELESAVARSSLSLHESEERFRQLAENIRNVFWLYDLHQQRFIYVSPAYEAIMGRVAAPLYEDAGEWSRSVHPSDAAKVQRGAERRRRGEPFEEEYRVLLADGSVRWLYERGFSVRDDAGRVYRMAGLVEDVTRRREAEMALRESDRVLTTLISNLPGMVYRCALHPDWPMEFVSQGCKTVTGHEPDALTSGTVHYGELIHPDDRDPMWREVQSAVRQRLPYQLTYRIQAAGGELKWAWEQGRGVFDEHGELTALEGFIADITERRRAEEERRALEERLRQAQKLESLGTLSAGVAHDFNNLLTAVVGYLDLARASLPSDSAALDALAGIEEAAKQASGVAKSLLTFSRKSPIEKKPLHVGQLVKQSIRMLRHILPANIEIITDVADSPELWVEADMGQMQQVLMNLAINARDALPDGGKFKITVRHQPGRKGRDGSGGARRSLGHAILSVEDTGAGIPAEVRHRVFEPFFTTKPREHGTGLGLAVIHGIVEEHRGRIDLESEPGRGTRVAVRLPCCAIPSKAAQPASTPPPVSGRNRTIVLAEDNPHVHAILTSALRSAGFRVLPALDGLQAMKHLRDVRRPAHLVVLDLDLPGRSGLSCLNEILQRQPPVPVLVVTGSISDALDDRLPVAGAGRGRVVMLRKPFPLSDFLLTIRNMLDAAEPAESPSS